MIGVEGVDQEWHSLSKTDKLFDGQDIDSLVPESSRYHGSPRVHQGHVRVHFSPICLVREVNAKKNKRESGKENESLREKKKVITSGEQKRLLRMEDKG